MLVAMAFAAERYTIICRVPASWSRSVNVEAGFMDSLVLSLCYAAACAAVSVPLANLAFDFGDFTGFLTGWSWRAFQFFLADRKFDNESVGASLADPPLQFVCILEVV
jgi:hypothetical protein